MGRTPLRVAGWLLMLAGVVFALYGAAPLRAAFDVLQQGARAGDGGSDRLDLMTAQLKSRLWADGVGFVLLVVGAVLDGAGKRSLDERIAEAMKSENSR